MSKQLIFHSRLNIISFSCERARSNTSIIDQYFLCRISHTFLSAFFVFALVFGVGIGQRKRLNVLWSFTWYPVENVYVLRYILFLWKVTFFSNSSSRQAAWKQLTAMYLPSLRCWMFFSDFHVLIIVDLMCLLLVYHFVVLGSWHDRHYRVKFGVKVIVGIFTYCF